MGSSDLKWRKKRMSKKKYKKRRRRTKALRQRSK